MSGSTRSRFLGVLFVLALAAVCALGLAGTANADPLYWSGTGTWDDGNTPKWGIASNGPYDANWIGGYDARFEGTAGAVTVSGTINSVGAIYFDANDYTLGSGTIKLTGAGGNITTIAGNNTINSIIDGSVGLTKNGTGILTLGGVNSYTGATTIKAGTLALGSAGTIANSTTITVGDAGSSGAVLDLTAKAGFNILSGQTLTGIGTVNIGSSKTVTVDAGGHWAPGNSIGTNAVTGDLTLSGISDFELGTAGASHAAPGTSDRTDASGAPTLGGTLNLIDNAGANGQGSAGAGSYLIFTQAGTAGGSFAAITNIAGYHAKVYTADSNSVYLDNYQIAAANIPTPVALTNVHVGGTFGTSALNITNTASSVLSEGLNATKGAVTGDANVGGTNIVNLAGGASSTSISVGLGAASTATAGLKTGTVTIDLASNGANSGYADTALASQVITVNGKVYDYAVANTITTPVAFGLIHQGSTRTIALSISNTAAGDPTFIEGLDATKGAVTGHALVSGADIVNLAGGASSSTILVGLNTVKLGAKLGTVTIDLASNGTNSGLASTPLTPQVITVTGQAYSGKSTWIGGDPNYWGTLSSGFGVNWGPNQGSPGVDPEFTGVDTATFGSTAGAVTVNLDGAAPSLNAVTFNGTGSYTIAQGTDANASLTLAGTTPAITATGTQVISAPVILASNTGVAVTNAPDSLTISGAISSGNGSGLTKSGAGTLTLTNTNSYTGTTVNAGTLALSGSGTLGVTTGALTADGSTAIVDLGTTAQTVGAVSLRNGAQINSTSGTLTGTSYALESGSASAILTGVGPTKTTPGTVTLSGANTYTGVTTITQGALRISSVNGLGTTAGNTVVSGSGAALQLSGAGITYDTEALALTGTGISTGGALQNVSGNNTWAGAITLNSASAIGSAGGTLNITGGISGAFGLTFNAAGSANININADVLGATVTPITKIGAGGLTVSQNSTSVAPISVNAGTLTLSGNGVLANVAPGSTVTYSAVNTGRTDGSTVSTSPLPAGFQPGSFALGQAVIFISGTTAYNSDRPAGFAAGVQPYQSGVMALPGAAIVVDNSGTNINYRFGGSAGTLGRAVSLGGASLNLIPSTTGTVRENLAGLVLMQGHSAVTLTADPNWPTRVTAGILNIRGATTSTALIRGSNFGSADANGVSTLTFTAAPTFIGSTTTGGGTTAQGILPYVIVGSTPTSYGTRFATTSGAAQILRPLAAGEMDSVAYTAGKNILQAGALPAIAAGVSINSLTIDSGNVTITTPAFPTAPATLTISSGGLLSNATSTISGGILTLSNQMDIFTPGATAAANVLTISSRVSGSGLVKAGGGTLLLNSTSPAFPAYSQNNITGVGNHAGSVYLSEGVTKLGAHNAIGSTGYTSTGQNDNNSLTLDAGATLDLNGKSQFVGALNSQFSGDNTSNSSTGTGITGGSGGIVTSFGGPASFIVAPGNPGGGPAAWVFAGSIQGPVGFAIGPGAASARQELTGPSNSTGPILIDGTTLTVLRDYGTMSGFTRMDINSGSGFTIDNTYLANINGRLNPAGSVYFNNGSQLTYKGRAATNSTEAVGAVTAAQGLSTVTVTPGGTNTNSADLTFTSLAATASTGGAVRFLAGGGTLGSSATGNPHINISGATPDSLRTAGVMVNNIIPWALVGNSTGANFASYIPYTSTSGVTAGGIGQIGSAGYPTNTNAAPIAVNAPTVDYQYGGSFTITANVNINSFRSTGYQSVAFTTGTEILNLTSGGLLVDGALTNTIGATVDSGRITAGDTASTGTFGLYVFEGNRGFIINSRIIDNPNGAKVRLVANQELWLTNPNNSYTGGSVMNSGNLTLSATSAGAVIPDANIPANGLVINGGTVTLNNRPGQIGSANIVTLNGNSTLNLFGNNTLAGLVLNNIGTSAPTVNTTPSSFNAATNSTDIALTLTGGITSTSNNIQTVATINGRLILPSSTTLNVGAATFNGLAINPFSPDLNLTGVTGGGGTITKSGDGVLRFNVATVLTGTLDVTAGGIQIGTANAGASLANVILENGAWLNLAGQAGLFGSLAAPGTGMVTNTGALSTLTVGFTDANTTFAGSFQRHHDGTINLINLTKIGAGTMTLTGNASTASGTMTINSTAGGGVKFIDAGVNNFVQNAITVNAGGVLTLDDTGTANLSNRLTNAGVTLAGGSLVSTAAAAGSTETTTGALTLNSGESTVTLNQGAVSNVTTFGSLGFGTGGTGTFAGTNIGTATDKVLFTSAPGLTNNILPRLAVGTDFVTYNQDGAGAANTNGIQAVTAYSAATNINTAANTDTLKTSTTTALTLTAAKTINAINVNTNSATIGTSGAILPTAGLTLASGGVIVNGTGATISTPVLAESAVGIFRVNSGADLNVNSRITGTAGITKTGAGDLTLSKPQEYTGTTTVNQGKITLAGGLGKNPLLVTVTTGNPSAPTLQMNGGTLDLNGNSQFVGPIQSSNPFVGGTITSTAEGSAATLTSFSDGLNTFGGTIAGNLNFTLDGGRTENLNGGNSRGLIFKNQQSFTGATVVRNAALTLQDKGALYSGVGDLTNASVTLNHAFLVIDNSGLNPSATPPSRIPSTVPITLKCGTIGIIAGASTDNSNTLGTVTADYGLNCITINNAQATTGTALSNTSGATNDLTITKLANSANGGLVNLFAYSNSFGAYTNSKAQRLFINNYQGVSDPNPVPVTAGAMLPAWIGIGNGTGNGTLFTDFATLSSTGFGIVGFGDTALGGPGYAGTFASGSVTSVGATALAAASTTTKALKLTGALTFSVATNSLNLESGGLISTGQQIGGSANSGVLTAGGTALIGTTDLVLANASATAMTVNSIIKDTSTVIGSGTAKVRLILTEGNGTVTLAGNNTYSGGTIVMGGREGQGAIALGGAGVIIPAGGLILHPNFSSATQRALTTTAAGQIDSANDVTIVGSGYGLTMLAGSTNTLSSLIFQNIGGGSTGTTPLVDVATKLILTKTTASGSVINSTNDSMSSIPRIQGTELNLPDGATITTSGEAPVDLNIATTSLTTTGATLPLHKAGAGSVILTPQSSFANGFNLDGGSIIFTANSVGGGTGGTAPTTSQIGTGTLKLADGTAIMSDNNRSIGNVVDANGASFTFGTLAATNARANATNNLTLTNTVTLGTGAHTINVNGLNMTGTISGTLTGGTNLTKGGPGTLALSGNNTYGGTTTIAAGTLKLSGAYTNNIASSTTITVAGGAGLDVTGLTSNTLVLGATQTLKGTGTVSGNVTAQDGTKVTPGGSVGTLSIVGNVRMDANAIYEWELGATTADKVSVTGSLSFADGWDLAIVDAGGTPAIGSKYDLFTYTVDSSPSLAADIIASPAGWPTPRVFQNTGAKTIYVQFGLLGDTNNDWVVDAADYITVKQNFGMTSGATWSMGNFDGDGNVDWDDLQIVMANFGTRSIGGAPATPEPATLGLLAIGALALLRRRRTA